MRFLDITFANAAGDAAYQGFYTVPSSPVGGNKYAVAVALKICEGTPFVSGRLSWFALGDAALPATGTLDVEDYVEGEFARGSYDLDFAGAHVVGSFDAGWCP
jgi:hypothetical protein